ncbi:MAG TPA: IS200/IS605 family transposase [Roseiflexaceae bacterium]|nr:IS200/IS605 family transposase [Roseiflexaceae bacterium]
MSIYTQLYLHCIWATWDRLPLIQPTYEQQLYAVLLNKCTKLGCNALAVGGTTDHIHLLISFTSTITIAKLVGEIKGTSSHAMTHIIAPETFFKWQGGYGALTIGKRSLSQVQAYILNQKQHHANGNTIRSLECWDAINEIT